MSLEVVRRSQEDPYEALVAALKRVIIQIVDERMEAQAEALVQRELARVQPPRRWGTVAQASAHLGISQEAVRARIKRGHLDSRRLDGRIYVDMESFERRLDELLP